MIQTVLKECWLRGMISTTEDGVGDYSVSYAMREETDENDRVVRKYILGQFKFKLAEQFAMSKSTVKLQYRT